MQQTKVDRIISRVIVGGNSHILDGYRLNQTLCHIYVSIEQLKAVQYAKTSTIQCFRCRHG